MFNGYAGNIESLAELWNNGWFAYPCPTTSSQQFRISDIHGRMFNGYAGNIEGIAELWNNGWFAHETNTTVTVCPACLSLSANALSCIIGIIDMPEYNQVSDLPNGWLRKCPEDTDYDPERELHKMLIMEMYNMWGVPMIYYANTFDTNYNKIWGEDNDSFIASAFGNITASGTYAPFEGVLQRYDIMVYYELPQEQQTNTILGIEWLDELVLYISKEHFSYMTSGYTPKVGDILHPQYTPQHYEISYVKDKVDQFEQDQYVWEVHCITMVDERRNLSASLSGSEISHVNEQDDNFEINSTVDSKKDDIVYPDNALMERVKRINQMGGW